MVVSLIVKGTKYGVEITKRTFEGPETEYDNFYRMGIVEAAGFLMEFNKAFETAKRFDVELKKERKGAIEKKIKDLTTELELLKKELNK